MNQENVGCTAVSVIGILTVLSILFCCLAHLYSDAWSLVSLWTAGSVALLALIGHFALPVNDFRIMFRAAVAANLICMFLTWPLYVQVA